MLSISLELLTQVTLGEVVGDTEEVSRTQHLITKIQHVCQEICDIKENRTYQNPQKTHIKPQASTRICLHHQNHSNRTPSLNTLSSSKADKPIPREESRMQKMINNSNFMPKDPPQGPQNHAEHPILVMDMVIFRTIFFELLVFFTFTLLTIHFTY